jgi:hypothetical protein
MRCAQNILRDDTILEILATGVWKGLPLANLKSLISGFYEDNYETLGPINAGIWQNGVSSFKEHHGAELLVMNHS